MIAYGTKIDSDIAFALELDAQKTFRYRIDLRASAFDPSVTPFEIASFELHGRSVTIRSDRPFDQSVPGQPWSYTVKDIATFFWCGAEKNIFYTLHGNGDRDLLGFWFIHLVLPFYLTLERVYDFLHAGAVDVDGKSVLFIAPSMGGKSTMTDYFLRRGHNLISDDKVATFVENGCVMLAPSHAYHRPYRRAETLGDHTERVVRDFKATDTIISLKAVAKNDDAAIRRIAGYQKFDVLYPNYLFAFAFLKKERMQYLAGMLNKVQVFEVNVPWDRGRIGEVYNRITKELKLQAKA